VGDWPCFVNSNDGASSFVRLEEIASLRGIQASLATSSTLAGRAFDVSELHKAAKDGDKAIAALLECLARTIGQVISQLNCAFNPGKVILAGIFPAFGADFLEKLHEHFRSSSSADNLPRVSLSDLGEFNGAIGAAALAVHEWKPESQRK
jgi:predicted NBD/HSP70 family sugar kinase